MIYVTGDTYGDQKLWKDCFNEFFVSGDTVIIAGDFGVVFFDGAYWPEEMFYDHLEKQPYNILFCDGNHENFNKLNSYEVREWNGGRVHFIRRNIIHLMRGEVYIIDGKKLFVFGGGYSIDRDLRIPGKTWWAEEMPTKEECRKAMNSLEKCEYKVDYILTHTASTDTMAYIMKQKTGGQECGQRRGNINRYFTVDRR